MTNILTLSFIRTIYKSRSSRQLYREEIVCLLCTPIPTPPSESLNRSVHSSYVNLCLCFGNMACNMARSVKYIKFNTMPPKTHMQKNRMNLCTHVISVYTFCMGKKRLYKICKASWRFWFSVLHIAVANTGMRLSDYRRGDIDMEAGSLFCAHCVRTSRALYTYGSMW